MSICCYPGWHLFSTSFAFRMCCLFLYDSGMSMVSFGMFLVFAGMILMFAWHSYAPFMLITSSSVITVSLFTWSLYVSGMTLGPFGI